MSKSRNTPPASPGGKREASPTGETLDELYLAHQVHTLAQLLFRQMAGRQNPAMSVPAFGSPQIMPQVSWAACPPAPAMDCRRGDAPGLVYWYP